MSKMSELAIDIERLYTEGYSANDIGQILGCGVGLVLDLITEFVEFDDTEESV